MNWADTAYIEKLEVAPDGMPISKSEKLVVPLMADCHRRQR
jgi:hypothetical protein